MKTPRELLLARHESVNAKLNVLRKQVVAEHVVVPTAEAVEPAAGFLGQVWLELFWSCRRAWMGLAAAWVMLACLHLACSSPPSTVAHQPSRPSPQMQALLREQNQLRHELIAAYPSEPVIPFRFRLGPRSEVKPPSIMA